MKCDAREGLLGYVVRIHSFGEDDIRFVGNDDPIVHPVDYEGRTVFSSMIDAAKAEKEYNACCLPKHFARIVPNGGKEYCETVEPFTYTWYCG